MLDDRGGNRFHPGTMISSRRQFLGTASLLSAAAIVPDLKSQTFPEPGALKGRFYKTLKIGMVREGKSLS